jgi:2'-5' RNA ligase
VIPARAAFAANWLVMSRWLAGPGRPRRLEPLRLGEPRFVSCIARLPAEIAARLEEAAAPLGRFQPEHHRYPADEIHMTVLGLADSAGAEELAAIVARHGPLTIEVGGLNVSPSTVFAELYPHGSGLLALRRDLRRAESDEHGPVARWLRRRLAHANVIRFGAPVDPRLLAGVGSLRRARFGRFRIDEVELVRTDKVLSGAGTRTLARFTLR